MHLRYQVIFLFALIVSTAAYANLLNPYRHLSVFQLLSEVIEGDGVTVECDFDITSSDSYSGTGTAWSSLESGCEDLTFTGDFVGTAGTQSAYLDIDSGEYLHFGSSVSDGTENPSALAAIANPAGGGQYWVAMAYRQGDDPNTGSGPFFGNFGGGSDTFSFEYAGTGNLGLRYKGAALEVLEQEFGVLPRRNEILIFNFDHDAGKLRVFRNLDEYYEVDYTATAVAQASPWGFRFFSNATQHNTADNKRLYAISIGEGVIDRTKARGIISTYNARRGIIFTPTSDCTGLISNCVNDVLFELQADTYTSGSTWANSAEFPSDSASQTDYDFTIDGLTHVTGTDTYFETDGNDTARLAITSTQDGLYNMMAWTDPPGAHIWCVAAVRTAPTATVTDQTFYGNAYCTGATCDETGTGLVYRESDERLLSLALYDNAFETHSDDSPLQPDTDALVGLRTAAYGTNGTFLITNGFYNNSDIVGGTPNNFENEGNATLFTSTGEFTIGANWDETTSSPISYMPAGSRIYGMVCGTGWDSQPFMNKVMRGFENRYNIDFDKNGLVGIVNQGVYDGQQYAAGTQETSGSATNAEPPPAGLTGIEIKLSYTGWASHRAFAIVHTDGTNLASSLTKVTYSDTTTDFSTISAGEYTTNSNYDQNAMHTWDAGTIHWNDSSGHDMSIFVEFSSVVDPADIGSIQICNSVEPSPIELFDTEGNAITVSSNVRSGDVTIDGATSLCSSGQISKLTGFSL